MISSWRHARTLLVVRVGRRVIYLGSVGSIGVATGERALLIEFLALLRSSCRNVISRFRIRDFPLGFLELFGDCRLGGSFRACSGQCEL